MLRMKYGRRQTRKRAAPEQAQELTDFEAAGQMVWRRRLRVCGGVAAAGAGSVRRKRRIAMSCAARLRKILTKFAYRIKIWTGQNFVKICIAESKFA